MPRPLGSKNKETIRKEAQRQKLRSMVFRDLVPLVSAQIENAKGLKYLVIRNRKTGKFERVTESIARQKMGLSDEIIEVWEKDPSVHAFVALMDRSIDKPTESVDSNVAAKVSFEWEK